MQKSNTPVTVKGSMVLIYIVYNKNDMNQCKNDMCLKMPALVNQIVLF